MKHTPSSSPSEPEPRASTPPGIDELHAALDAHIAELRAQRGDDRATRREGVYMLLFHLGLIASLGAVYGYFAHARVFARQAQHHASRGFWEQRALDAANAWRGLQLQVAEYWWLDLGLVAMAAIVAFALKSQRTRRRWFRTTALMTAFLLLLPWMTRLVEMMAG